MRNLVSFVGLLLLPFVVGCEGDSPRRSPFAVTSSPTSAKTVEYAPVSKNAMPPGRPVNPTGQPAVDVPGAAANTPITIDGDKLETRRQLLNYHTAIFLRSEVGGLATTGVQDNNNFVFRPAEGLDKLRIIPAVSGYRALNGKAPQTPQEFLKLMAENAIDLAELKPDEFYVYDPVWAADESKKENLEYLQQYP